MKTLLCSLVAAVFCTVSAVAKVAPLFKYKGKIFDDADLPPALQQSLFEVKKQYHTHVTRMIEAHIVDEYIRQEAKKSKVSEDEMKAKLIKEKAVGDKEAKAWYDKNKKLVGGQNFDGLKEQIKRVLRMQQKELANQELLGKAQKLGKFKLLLPEPVAPVIKIAHQGFPRKGASTPKVRIVEFADYQCPHCKHASNSLKQVVKKFAKNVELVYVDFPVNRSGISGLVAEGAYCALEQKRFWDFHYLAFSKQQSLSKDSPEQFAKDLKLNLGKFKSCMSSGKGKKMVARGTKEGERIGVNGTPSIFINGQRFFGYDQNELEKAIKKLL